MDESKALGKQLPDSINVVNHVSGRIRELKKIYNDVACNKKEMLIHQMLPNFMRRRAMSHNPKRLPAKYRHIHKNQMQKSGLENQVKKRPSRKYRRKPSNLLKEYTRRSKNYVWLETHIWHAKRFRMKNVWGYKIPWTPTDKSYRASYRAAVKHCLLQDISYYPCIEISGPFNELREELKKVVSSTRVPSIAGRCYVNGMMEGKCTIFKANSYPYGAITEVSFLWRSNQDDSHRTLWMFSHPSAHQELLDELVKLFNLTKNESNSTLLNRYQKYENSVTKVSIINLKDTLNRFRLTGSHASSVLSKAFNVSPSSHWLQDSKFNEPHSAQKELWVKFCTAELPLGCVISLNIDDPRTNRNGNKREIRNENVLFNNGCEILDITDKISNSPIWDRELRDSVTKSMMTSSELNKLRYQKQLIPSISTSFEKKMLQPVPILIIQQSNGMMSGFDLIIPSGYALSVWLSLIKFGAKAGGWREYEMVLSEMGKEAFEPDTISGANESQNLANELRNEFFKKPPNKRANYTKLGIASPFKCPFNDLLSEWNGEKCESFFILRDTQKLEELSKARKISLDKNSLIPVKIEMMSNGSPENNSILCLPNKKDIKFAQMTKHRNSSAYHENIHPDPNESERKVKRFAHKKILKRLKNKRKREKRKNSKKGAQNYHKDLIEKQYKEMCNLWLPQPKSIRQQCSREVIGYVTKSRFTFSLGKVSSIAYIPAKAFEELIKKFERYNEKPFVLIRSPNSNCYYTAKIFVK